MIKVKCYYFDFSNWGKSCKLAYPLRTASPSICIWHYPFCLQALCNIYPTYNVGSSSPSVVNYILDEILLLSLFHLLMLLARKALNLCKSRVSQCPFGCQLSKWSYRSPALLWKLYVAVSMTIMRSTSLSTCNIFPIYPTHWYFCGETQSGWNKHVSHKFIGLLPALNLFLPSILIWFVECLMTPSRMGIKCTPGRLDKASFLHRRANWQHVHVM